MLFVFKVTRIFRNHTDFATDIRPQAAENTRVYFQLGSRDIHLTSRTAKKVSLSNCDISMNKPYFCTLSFATVCWRLKFTKYEKHSIKTGRKILQIRDKYRVLIKIQKNENRLYISISIAFEPLTFRGHLKRELLYFMEIPLFFNLPP